MANSFVLEEDWRVGLSLSKRFLYLLEESLETDVTFEVYDAENSGVLRSIKAHKVILISASEVFHKMFYGHVPEEKSVRVEEITYQTFKDLLRYMYSGEVQIDLNNALFLWMAADKYMLKDLRQSCVKYLCQHADLFFGHPTFVKTPRPFLDELLCCPNLYAYEIDIFIAILLWAKERIKDEKCKSNGNLDLPRSCSCENSPIPKNYAKFCKRQKAKGIYTWNDPLCARHGLYSDGNFIDSPYRSIVCTCTTSGFSDFDAEPARLSTMFKPSEIIASETVARFRETLKELLDRIRFPLMSQVDFTDIRNSLILTNAECQNIRRHRDCPGRRRPDFIDRCDVSFYLETPRIVATISQYYPIGSYQASMQMKEASFKVRFQEPYDVQGFAVTTNKIARIYIQTTTYQDTVATQTLVSKRADFRFTQRTWVPNGMYAETDVELVFSEIIRNLFEIKVFFYLSERCTLNGTALTLGSVSTGETFELSSGGNGRQEKTGMAHLTTPTRLCPIKYLLCCRSSLENKS